MPDEEAILFPEVFKATLVIAPPINTSQVIVPWLWKANTRLSAVLAMSLDPDELIGSEVISVSGWEISV